MSATGSGSGGARARAAPRATLRVAHLITDLDVGGAERMLANLVSAMAPAFENRVYCMTGAGPVAEAIAAHGVAVESLHMPRGWPGLAGYRHGRRLLRAFRPHVLQTWLYHADLMGTAFGVSLPDSALVWNLRCADMDLSRYRPLTRVVRRCLAWLSRRPRAVVVNSAAGQRHHQRLGYAPRRWARIGNGFDVERFRPRAEAAAALRARLGLAPDARVVGMVARHDPAKDHETLLAAAKVVCAARGDVFFYLVGDGLDALRARISALGLDTRVRTEPARADIEQVYPALDLAVLSSAWGEAFPNVIGEAMACGVPCVATDVGDVGEILGGTGLVVPRADAAALAAALLAALGWSAEERRRHAEAARERVARNHSLDAVARAYEALYLDLGR